jgi:hypothetical protein
MLSASDNGFFQSVQVKRGVDAVSPDKIYLMDRCEFSLK